MTKYLELDYSHSYILEGFRKNDAFIENHKECLDMLSDKIWRDNKYMNTEKTYHHRHEQSYHAILVIFYRLCLLILAKIA